MNCFPFKEIIQIIKVLQVLTVFLFLDFTYWRRDACLPKICNYAYLKVTSNCDIFWQFFKEFHFCNMNIDEENKYWSCVVWGCQNYLLYYLFIIYFKYSFIIYWHKALQNIYFYIWLVEMGDWHLLMRVLKEFKSFVYERFC